MAITDLSEVENLEIQIVKKKLGVYKIIREQESLINEVRTTQILLKGNNYYEIIDRLKNKGLSPIIYQGNYITNSSLSLYQILDCVVKLEYGVDKTQLTIFNEKKEKRQITIKHLDEVFKDG